MSSHDQPYDAGRGRIPRQKIEDAMQEVAEYRRLYLEATQSGQAADRSLQSAFHTAVLNYWIELRNYRNWDILGQKWEEAHLWRDNENQWVTGLDNLERWIDRTQTITVNDGGGYDKGNPDQREIPQPLPGKALLRVSMILDEIASELGLRIEIDDGKRPKGRVSNPDENTEDDDS